MAGATSWRIEALFFYDVDPLALKFGGEAFGGVAAVTVGRSALILDYQTESLAVDGGSPHSTVPHVVRIDA
jgi:hypothetical protein